MKFSPEIEAKYLSELSKIEDAEKKQKLIELKQAADDILGRIKIHDTKYGSIEKLKGSDRFLHTININHNQQAIKLPPDTATSIEHFLGFFLWHPITEILEYIHSADPRNHNNCNGKNFFTKA